MKIEHTYLCTPDLPNIGARSVYLAYIKIRFLWSWNRNLTTSSGGELDCRPLSCPPCTLLWDRNPPRPLCHEIGLWHGIHLELDSLGKLGNSFSFANRTLSFCIHSSASALRLYNFLYAGLGLAHSLTWSVTELQLRTRYSVTVFSTSRFKPRPFVDNDLSICRWYSTIYGITGLREDPAVRTCSPYNSISMGIIFFIKGPI